MIVGQPVASADDYDLRGVITAAPAPGMRVVDWDDGDHGDVDTRDLVEIMCAWFALCENTATALEPHPVLGPVPICGRCKSKIDGLRS